MSEMKIKDGTGEGDLVKVDANNRIRAFSDMQDAGLYSTFNGGAWNINTGDITLTDGTESAVLYMKNNETRNFIIKALAVGIGALSGTVSNPAKVTMVRQPTGGTIVSNATACDMVANRNFGSNKTNTSLAYKGAQGYTLTGGSDIAQFYQNGNGRLFAGIDFVMPQGAAMGVNIQLNATSGGVLYVAIVGYLED